MKVGFIGLGNMGLHQARRLLEHQFELCVYNRTLRKCDEFVARGASMATSVGELTRQVDVVLTCLADVKSTREVYLGKHGIIKNACPEKLLIDHATVDLQTSQDIHQRAKEKDICFLDAPISGGPNGAKNGTLTIMVGGESLAFKKAEMLFQVMGKTIMHMGGSGTGTVAKLINQLLVGVHSVVSCEAVLLALKSGVDGVKLRKVLTESWGSSRMLERNAPIVWNQELGVSDVPLRTLAKDLEIVVALANELGLFIPLAQNALKLHREALRRGMGDRDVAAISMLMEEDIP